MKYVLFESNLNAASGTDSITSLLYKGHWVLLGDSLREVVSAIHDGEIPTVSQRTSVMVYESIPKNLNSLNSKDKRRISLLNSDFKFATGLDATLFKKTFTHTLSYSDGCWR